VPARALLVAALSLLSFGIEAQSGKPLDLQYRTETKGTVIAIRDVYATGKGPTPAGAQAASATEASLDTGMPVGAVAYWNFGPGAGDGMKVGAVGRGDMQNWLTDHAKEVVVKMDDGERRTFRPSNTGQFQPNQRVTVRAGLLEPSK
jgi:hypothetical protein